VWLCGDGGVRGEGLAKPRITAATPHCTAKATTTTTTTTTTAATAWSGSARRRRQTDSE